MLSSGTRDARQAHNADILASPVPPAISTRARLVAVAEGATASARERRAWPEAAGAGCRRERGWSARCALPRGAENAALLRMVVRGCAGGHIALVACGLAAQSRGGVLTCACGGAQGTSQRARTQ